MTGHLPSSTRPAPQAGRDALRPAAATRTAAFRRLPQKWALSLAASAAVFLLAACGNGGTPEPQAAADEAVLGDLVADLRAANQANADAIAALGRDLQAVTGAIADLAARQEQATTNLDAAIATIATDQQGAFAALAAANAAPGAGPDVSAELARLAQRINDLAAAQSAWTAVTDRLAAGNPEVAAAIADLQARQETTAAALADLAGGGDAAVAEALAAIAGQLTALEARLAATPATDPPPATPPAAGAVAAPATAATPPAPVRPAAEMVPPPGQAGPVAVGPALERAGAATPASLPAPAPAATAATAAAPRTGGGDLAANPTTIEMAINGADFTLSQNAFELETGKLYRWVITNDGAQEVFITAEDLFRYSWIEQIRINGIEVMPSMGFAGLEFDEPGELIVRFVPITPREYPFSVQVRLGPNVVDAGMNGTMVVR